MATKLEFFNAVTQRSSTQHEPICLADNQKHIERTVLGGITEWRNEISGENGVSRIDLFYHDREGSLPNYRLTTVAGGPPQAITIDESVVLFITNVPECTSGEGK